MCFVVILVLHVEFCESRRKKKVQLYCLFFKHLNSTSESTEEINTWYTKEDGISPSFPLKQSVVSYYFKQTDLLGDKVCVYWWKKYQSTGCDNSTRKFFSQNIWDISSKSCIQKRYSSRSEKQCKHPAPSEDPEQATNKQNQNANHSHEDQTWISLSLQINPFEWLLWCLVTSPCKYSSFSYSRDANLLSFLNPVVYFPNLLGA